MLIESFMEYKYRMHQIVHYLHVVVRITIYKLTVSFY